MYTPLTPESGPSLNKFRKVLRFEGSGSNHQKVFKVSLG